jgi:hypothetical protein
MIGVTARRSKVCPAAAGGTPTAGSPVSGKELVFGQNMIPDAPGIIRVGDRIHVLEQSPGLLSPPERPALAGGIAACCDRGARDHSSAGMKPVQFNTGSRGYLGSRSSHAARVHRR